MFNVLMSLQFYKSDRYDVEGQKYYMMTKADSALSCIVTSQTQFEI